LPDSCPFRSGGYSGTRLCRTSLREIPKQVREYSVFNTASFLLHFHFVKDYYKILEVDKNATQRDIKSAYRLLAKKYHPDRSNFASAGQLFTEVNEAYGVLSDAGQKQTYDQRRTGNYQKTQYRRTYRARKTQSVDLEPYVSYFKSVSIAGLVLSLLLSIDFLIPRNVISEQIVNLENVIGYNRSGQRFLMAIKVTTDNEVYEISEDLTIGLSVNQSIDIQKSQLLSITTSVDFAQGNDLGRYYLAASIYRNFSFAWMVLLITSIAGTALKKSAEMILNLAIVNGILSMLVIYFTLIS